MSVLSVQADLAVAALDLKLVRLLRDAIRTADLSSGVACGPFGTVCIDEPRRHFHPEPVIEPRQHIHPTPRYEPREVYRTTPRVCDSWKSECPPPPGSYCDPSKKCKRSDAEPVLAAPWRTPVWKMPIAPAAKVKVNVHQVDVQNKGSLIDLFL